VPLSSLPEGALARVERVSDESPARLRYLAELGIVPGAPVKVVERAPFAGPITIKVGSTGKSIGAELASQILVIPRRS
jgi:DtxR family Mn-dependent transcriptional regulator